MKKKTVFVFKDLILILVIFSCSNISSSENELVRLFLNSKINSYENSFTKNQFEKHNNSLSKDIVKKIIDSLDYSCITKGTISVLNTTHLKINDNYSFFDVVLTYNDPIRKINFQDSIVGFYGKNNVYLVENLCDDVCSKLQYSNLILIDGAIKIQNIETYSCDLEDFDYIRNVYTIKDGIMICKSDKIDSPPLGR